MANMDIMTNMSSMNSPYVFFAIVVLIFVVTHLLWELSVKQENDKKYSNRFGPEFVKKMVHIVIVALYIVPVLIIACGYYGKSRDISDSYPFVLSLFSLAGAILCMKRHALWRFVASSEYKGDDENASIAPEVLLLAGFAASVVWLVWDFYQSNCGICGSASDGGF